MTALYWRLGEKFARERPVRLSWDRGSFALFQAHDDLVAVKTVVSRQSAEQINSNYLKYEFTITAIKPLRSMTLVKNPRYSQLEGREELYRLVTNRSFPDYV